MNNNPATKGMAVTYTLLDNLGGVTTMLDNIIKYGGDQALPQKAFFLDLKENKVARLTGGFGGGIPTTYFSFSSTENWYSVYGRLSRLVGTEGGVLIANDQFELIMLSHFKVPKKVVLIMHDAHVVKLAVQYADIIDAFVCHTEFYSEVLRQFFPDRRDAIYRVPYGIPVVCDRRKPASPGAPLKLVFLGRHVRMKGIYDLMEIELKLQQRGIVVDWLIFGRGPESEAFKQQWKGRDNVRFVAPDSNEEVLKMVAERDILVFPTKFEGFPVVLVEAMSVGVVPVATDLPGGLRELVKNGTNGYLCEMDDNEAFAEKIAVLHHDRNLLEEISNRAYLQVNKHYNADLQSPKYQEIFTTVALSEGPPLHHSVKKRLGSRLDQPWIPNWLTHFLRNRK